ncbi:MAG: ABC transporter permease, partial [Cupriavidus sp.]
MSADVQFASLPENAVAHKLPTGSKLAAAALRFGSLLAFSTILVIFALTAPYFLTVGNIGNVLGQSAISGVLAIGLTIVLIAGGSN